MDRLWQRRAGLRPTEVAMTGAFFAAACLRDAGRRLEQAGEFQRRRMRGLVTVRFACFSLRYSCSEQRVHSGLYDGLTWPDTGCASLD